MYCEKVDMILQNAKSYGDDHQRELKRQKMVVVILPKP